MTGALFRFGLAGGGLPWELAFGDIRHAHSHLMFTGWVTPALMALIATRLSARLGESLRGPWKGVLWANLGLALASYPPFMLYGYDSAAVFGVELPVAVIVSTLNMFAWYAFAFLYWRQTRGRDRTVAMRVWDAAVLVLVVSSLGGYARGALIGMGNEDPFLTAAAVHFFVDLFSDGWLGLATLGVLYDVLDIEESRPGRWATGAILVGLPLSFLLGVPYSVTPPAAQLAGGVGGLVVGAGFVLHAGVLWRDSVELEAVWKVPLGLLAIKGLALMALVSPAVASWGEGAGMKIPYLHISLLGFVTLSLVEAGLRTWKRRGLSSVPMQVAVGVLLVSLLPTTTLWPGFLAGARALYVVAVGSLPPILVALWLLAGMIDMPGVGHLVPYSRLGRLRDVVRGRMRGH